MDEMKNNNLRFKTYKKDLSLETTLSALNELIEPLAKRELSSPHKPILLIMGSPRSGTTLLLQYLSSLGVFSYPSNIIARFWRNPYMGILSQKALQDLLESKSELDSTYKSDLGRSEGPLAPSEYWYFWREYFKFGLINKLDNKELEKVDQKSFLMNLSSFETLFDKSPVMKGMIMNWNIPYLHKIYPKFIFIHIKRDVLNSSKSLYNARQKFFNDVNKWYSFKPPEYDFLQNQTPIEQVVGQVYYTQRAVEDGLKQIPERNKISINYNDFCLNPTGLLDKIKECFVDFGEELDLSGINSSQFKNNTRYKFSEDENSSFEKAFDSYRNKK